MNWTIEPKDPVTLAVSSSSQRFPVGNVFCVGRNYADHAIEMGHDPDREDPFFFMKPDFAVLADGGDLQYPEFTADLHHEVELVVALGSGGRHISIENASQLIFGYSVGIDFTRRDLQGEAKEKGRPWEAGKVFLHAAPCSSLRTFSETGELSEGEIQLLVNGELRQSGNLNQMIWKIPEVIAKLSELFVLQPGDLIFTGTPAGVGPVQPGDTLQAQIESVGGMEIRVC